MKREIKRDLSLSTGSPPLTVIPSVSGSMQMRSARAEASTAVPPWNGLASGVMHPGQRLGHPWTQRAKRRNGPSTFLLDSG